MSNSQPPPAEGATATDPPEGDRPTEAPPSSPPPELDGATGAPDTELGGDGKEAAPAASSTPESKPWQPSPEATGNALGRDARAILDQPAPRGAPKAPAGRPALPAPALHPDARRDAQAATAAVRAQKGPPPAPPSELVGGSARRTVGDTPAGAASSASELVHGALSHMAHDTPGGPAVRATARHVPPVAGTTHTAGETPSAYDGRAMAARMGERKPAGRVSLADLGRKVRDRQLDRAKGAPPRARPGGNAPRTLGELAQGARDRAFKR